MVDVVILLEIAAILIFAKVYGEIAERLNIDSIVGELAAGLLLGPILLWVVPNQFLEELAFLGLVTMMFFIGIDVSYEDIKKEAYAGSVLGTIGAVAGFMGGFLLGWLLLDSMIVGAILGVAIMGTSTAIPLKIMIKGQQVKTRVGQALISTAMADDIATIVALSIVAKFVSSGSISIAASVTLLLAIIGFILVILAFGSKIMNVTLQILSKMKTEQIMVSLPLALAFIVAFIANELQIAAITGAFLAGVAMSGSKHIKNSIEPKIRGISYGFFIPIFFVYSAIIVDLSIIFQYWWILAATVLVALLPKMIAVYLGSKYIFGFKGKENGVLAISTIARGEYGIAVAQIGLTLGVVASEVYGAIIGMTIITIILTPIVFKIYFKRGYYSGV